MLQKSPEHIILNKCKSFSINKMKNFNNLNNIRTDLLKEVKFLSLENIQSPKKPYLIEKKSQTNLLKKTIKVSLNRYHNYIRKINIKKNNDIKRPFSFNINKKNINNREEIGNKYISLSRNKNFDNSFNNSSQKKTIFSSNNSSKKLNLLNLGIYSPINKKSNINKFNSTNEVNNNINKKVVPSKLYEKLKSSKFFNKTKYINGNKNKKIKSNKRTLLSTYIMLLESSQDDLIYNAINEIVLQKLMHSKKKINESNEKKNLFPNNNNNEIYQIQKAKYFDLLPIILNHLKNKKTIDDVNEEYNKYLLNNMNDTTTINKPNKINKIKNPIVRYLFLENIINNLKHIVKFININSKEEIEQNVIKIIGEEYSKLENNIFLNNKDFSTYGFEYVPKHRLLESYHNLVDKGMQTSKINDKKSIFFINEKKLEENNNTYSNNDHISPKRRIFLRNSLSNKRRINYDIKLFEEKPKKKEDLKKELNEIFSEKKIFKNIKQNGKKNNEIDFIKDNGLKNLKNIQNNRTKRSVSVQVRKLKPRFIKINLNKLKINNEINKNNIKRLDSTDKMNNPPSFERNNSQQKDEEAKNEKDLKEDKKKSNKNIESYYSSLKNDLLANKMKKENKNIKNEENEENESQENSGEDNEEKETPVLSKENLENLAKKSKKFTRKYKKALKEKKKMEKIYKKTLENTEITIREIKKAEKQRKKPKKFVFIELFNEGRKKSFSSEKEKKKEKENEDNYSSISSSKILSQLEKMKNDEVGEENNYTNEENEDDSHLSSVSEISKELEEFNEVKNLIKLKTKKEAFDDEKRQNTYRRRGGVVIPSPLVFKNIIKLKELSDLNDKMKNLYDSIYKEKKRDEFKNRRKKRYKYNFIGVDINNIKDVEIRKKVHLARIKEDIKYKIGQGKYRFEEFEFFQKFEKAMNSIDLSRLKENKKRINEYVHTLEKYFQLFYYELLNKERHKKEEDRINKFLYALHEEVGTTIPYVKYVKGKKCRSLDYNKENNLSDINLPNNL